MIIDSLSNASLYMQLGENIRRAFEFLQSTNLNELELGKHVIDGEKVFALVQEYRPKPANVGKFEAHRRYWDLQYVAQGEEAMGWGRLADMEVTEEYSPERDVAFYRGPGTFVTVPAGHFTIFSPQDVHMPGVETVRSGDVRKIVVKMEGPG